MSTVNDYTLFCIAFYIVFVVLAQGRILTSIDNEDKSNDQATKIEGIHQEDFLYETFHTKFLRKNFSDIHPLEEEDGFITHYAILNQLNSKDFYGAKATISCYSLPGVEDNQYSESKIWVANRQEDHREIFNVISAGCHVNPALYGNRDPHFFVNTGVPEKNIACYNLLCEGFVSKSTKYIPGWSLPINGEQQSEITLKIFKEATSGDWWLHAGPNTDEPVGYWPKSIFTTLTEYANVINWGGIVGFYKGDKSPPMGNGRYPHEGNAAYFKDVQIIYQSGRMTSARARRHEDKTDCYQLDGDEKQFYFGGPGGCID